MARDANRTFGGGTPTTEQLRRSFATRGWMSDEDHVHLYAVSRLTPGTNLLAYCTALGWRARGSSGALATWLASSLPSSAVAVAVTMFYESLARSRSLAIVVLIGMTIALALLASSAWQLARPHLQWSLLPRAISIVIVVIALQSTGVTPVRILVAAALVGALWRRRE